MRPERLYMRAFGPFADKETLDFSRLEGKPLFLIHGPTGAGKSTLLDAMCFALYGEASGADREAAQLRSQWAEPRCLTEVVLDFRLGEARYRVRRRPRQQRPKKRGEGFTTEEARAELFRRAPGQSPEEDGELLAHGVADVTRKVEELLGLNAAQFRQVIVLPQGEFRKLLTAETSERQKILQRLFETGIYAEIEEELKRRASVAREELRDIQSRLGALLHAHGLDDAPLAEAEQTLERRAEELEREVREISATIEETRAKEKAITALLHGREAEAEANRAHLAALNGLERARRAYAESHAALQRALEGENALEDLTLQISTLETALKDARQLAEHTARKRRREKALCDCRKELQEAEREQERLAENAQQARVLLDALRQQAARVELWRQQREQWRQALKQRGELCKLQAELKRRRDALDAREAALKRARARMERATEHWRVLQDRLRRAHAVLLARELKPGAPCPVCGSTRHPAPAGAADDARAPAEEELERAETALEQAQLLEQGARAARDEARQALSRLQGALEALQGNLAHPDLSEEALRERLQQAEAALNETLKAAEKVARTEDVLKDIQAREQALAVRLKELQERERSGAEMLSGLKSLVEDLRKRLPEDLRDAEAVQGRLDAARAEHERLKRALERAQRLYEAARRGLDAAQVRLSDAEAMRERAAETVEKAFRKALESAALPPDTTQPPAAEELLKMNDALYTSLSAAQGRKGKLEEARRRLEEARARLRRLAEDLASAQAAYDRLYGLAQMAAGTGANTKKISLQRFVLSALLDEVLAAASIRLHAMSQGRYALRRRDETHDLRKAWGLELEVMDYFTGKPRPVHTLSGGESFMAALSLALGLAEVVQRRSGGVWLQTLFIDEGFGALDAEALDQALNTLLDLRAEGRLIGIISHVPELRERIPARLRVEKAERGSRLRLEI